VACIFIIGAGGGKDEVARRALFVIVELAQ
jgi:hypothetical protein